MPPDASLIVFSFSWKLLPLARSASKPPEAAETVAGAEGFEPPLAVLETAGLPLNLRPYFTYSVLRRGPPCCPYLISLCATCLRQNGQNFFSSSRSVVTFLF